MLRKSKEIEQNLKGPKSLIPTPTYILKKDQALGSISTQFLHFSNISQFLKIPNLPCWETRDVTRI